MSLHDYSSRMTISSTLCSLFPPKSCCYSPLYHDSFAFPPSIYSYYTHKARLPLTFSSSNHLQRFTHLMYYNPLTPHKLCTTTPFTHFSSPTVSFIASIFRSISNTFYFLHLFFLSRCCKAFPQCLVLLLSHIFSSVSPPTHVPLGALHLFSEHLFFSSLVLLSLFASLSLRSSRLSSLG